MIAVDVRPERYSAETHLANPVELPVESEVLQNAEDADQEPENHPEPNEAAPVLKSSKGLRGKKEEEQVRQEEQELQARGVRGGGAPKEPLCENEEGKDPQRREKRTQE